MEVIVDFTPPPLIKAGMDALDIRTVFSLSRIPPSPMAQEPLVGQRFIIIEASLSHSHISHSAGLPWMSDQPVGETAT